MQKHIRENGNIIYGDLSKQTNLKLDFKGKNNIVFFAGSSKNIRIDFRGENGVVFIGNNVSMNGPIYLPNSGLCYIDDNCGFNGTTFCPYEAKNIILGRDCMFSWSTWLSTCDHHLIIDAKTNNRINFSKSIYVGDHVWCGQESAIVKGVFIGSGAMIGAKSMVTKKCYSNSVNAGMSSKEIKNEVFWLRDSPLTCNRIITQPK